MGLYPDRERSHAVLIGTSDYENTGNSQLDNLPGVHNNLVALEQALTNVSTGVFAGSRCTVVNNPDTSRSLMARLRRAADQAQDVLLVYYAGHGVLGGPNGDLYLAVRETDEYHPETTAVAFELVRHVIEASPAKTRILILDCCFSGRAIGAMSSTSAALEKINVSGTFILTSTEANREARALPGERYTAFTGELVNILNDGLPDHDDDVRLGDLYRPLQAAMAKRDLPRPKKSSGDTSGDLVLRRRPSNSPAPTPDSEPAPAMPMPAPAPKLNPEPADADLKPRPSTSAVFPGGDVSVTTAPPPAEPTRPSVHPLISDDSLRGIGAGLWTTTLWIFTVATGIFFSGAIGAAATGLYTEASTATTGISFFALLFSVCLYLLVRRYRKRHSTKNQDVLDTGQSTATAVSSRNQARKAFFEDIFSHITSSYPAIRAPRAPLSNWCQFASGPFGYYALTFSKHGYRVEIYLDTTEHQSTKQLFDHLYNRRAELHQDLAFELTWEPLDGNRASRIATYLHGFDLETSDRATCRQAIEWSAHRAEALHRVFDVELRQMASRLKTPKAGA